MKNLANQNNVYTKLGQVPSICGLEFFLLHFETPCQQCRASTNVLAKSVYARTDDKLLGVTTLSVNHTDNCLEQL